MTQPDLSQDHRSSFLSLLMGGMLAAVAVAFLLLLTGGLFVHVVAVTGGIGLMAMFHYLLWGKSLAERTAGEREEMTLNERARDNDAGPWTYRR